VRQDQVQAFGRLATDREHVIAYTHDATFSACFEPIDVIDQHDELTHFHSSPFHVLAILWSYWSSCEAAFPAGCCLCSRR
jgi:hypothetical protein